MATQFTPQQLTGGPKYNHRVKIGNWSEDLEMEEIKLKDYLSKKDTGSLIVTAKQKQLEGSLVPVELSPSPEGSLQFGMKIMLYNHQTAGVLGANPFDSAAKAYGAWMATTGPRADPVVRNVFELESTDGSDGAVLYGQNIRLKLSPFATISSPAYLQSEMVTPMSAAKFSRYQEVLVISEPAGDTKWQIQHPDPSLRVEVEGEEVPAGKPVLIKHVQTGAYLASDKIPYQNIFGPECEVHCHMHVPLTKAGVLVGEAKGETENSVKPMGLPNTWTIVTSTDGPERGGSGLDLTGMPAEM